MHDKWNPYLSAETRQELRGGWRNRLDAFLMLALRERVRREQILPVLVSGVQV